MEFLPYPHLIATLFNGCAFGPPPPFTAASAWTWIDHPVSGPPTLTPALLRLGFPSAPRLPRLTSPVWVTRRTVLQKVRGPTLTWSHSLWTRGFRFSFTPLPGFFSPFPHGTMLYRSLRSVSLGGWSPRLPTRFLVSRGTLDPARRLSLSPTGPSPSLAGRPSPFG